MAMFCYDDESTRQDQIPRMVRITFYDVMAGRYYSTSVTFWRHHLILFYILLHIGLSTTMTDGLLY